MPFYEYECSNCRFYVEVLQKISEQPLKKCPSCGKKALKKLVSAPVFRLKGSGWYETDFKSDQEGKRNLAGADKEDSSSEAKSDKPDAKATAADDTKADAKPDTKSDTKADSKSEASSAGGGAAKAGKRGTPARGKSAKSKAAVKSKAAGPKRAMTKPKSSAKRRRGR